MVKPTCSGNYKPAGMTVWDPDSAPDALKNTLCRIGAIPSKPFSPSAAYGNHIQCMKPAGQQSSTCILDRIKIYPDSFAIPNIVDIDHSSITHDKAVGHEETSEYVNDYIYIDDFSTCSVDQIDGGSRLACVPSKSVITQSARRSRRH